LGQTRKDGSVSNGQRVLVVDGLSDVQEVLQAVLEPRGLQVDWVRGQVQTHSSKETGRPDIVVIDAEAAPLAERQADDWAGVPQVIIGSQRFPGPAGPPLSATRQYLAKPFQYNELIQAIERLLPRRVA
jgi:CheY-like chemotaxis protein